MKIFFAGAIRGGREKQSFYTDILGMLESFGPVLSAHVADESLSPYGETELTAEEIYKRELERLGQADVVVAEVTTPSLGVGFLLKEATAQGKRTLCLYQGKHTDKLSAMIKGCAALDVIAYDTMQELETELKKSLSA